MTLNEICLPVKENIESFHEYFKNTMKTKVSLLNLVLRYITMRKGKRVRPALVFLTASMVGKVSERSNIGAAMIELLHTATLVHDDVVDKALERRGVASINAEWNNKIAVLVGDYLLSRGLQISVNNDEFDFLKVTSKAVKRMSEGELLSMDKGRKLEITEEEYFQIISDKTASLLSSCCEIGALSATNDKTIHEKMCLYGEYVGIAFQLQDDLLDYLSKSSILGKPVGNDLKERKITLPLIYAFSKSSKSEVKEVFSKIKSGKLSNTDISEIIEFVKLKGGIEYTFNYAKSFVNKAKELLNDMPDSPSKISLLNFADFVIERKS
jgi:octaprenyl-diphosphate synthase